MNRRIIGLRRIAGIILYLATLILTPIIVGALAGYELGLIIAMIIFTGNLAPISVIVFILWA